MSGTYQKPASTQFMMGCALSKPTPGHILMMTEEKKCKKRDEGGDGGRDSSRDRGGRGDGGGRGDRGKDSGRGGDGDRGGRGGNGGGGGD